MRRKHPARALAISALAILLSGCDADSGKNSGILHIDTDSRKITDINISQLERVDLKAGSDTLLLYSINDIQPFGSGYLIEDRDRLTYYSSDGNLICQIGQKGRGPGEYLRLASFYTKQDTICIFCNNTKSIFQYTVKDNKSSFIRQQAIPDTLSISALIQNSLYPDRYFAFNTYHGFGGTVPCVTVYDSNFAPIASSSACIKDGGMGWSSPFGSNSSGVLFTDFFSYTVTELDSGVVDESRKLDFGKNNVPENYLNYTDATDMMAFLKDSANISLQFPSKMYKDNNTLYISLRNSLIGTYDLKSGVSKVFRILDAEDNPVHFTAFNVCDGTLYIAAPEGDSNMENPPFYILPTESLT